MIAKLGPPSTVACGHAGGTTSGRDGVLYVADTGHLFRIDARRVLAAGRCAADTCRVLRVGGALRGSALAFHDGELWLDFGASGRLPVATRRLCAFSELTPEVAANSSQMFGLLRFDQRRWEIQPLGVAATVKKKNVILFSGESAAAVLKKPPKTSTIAILQERASRLLRGQ